jgi:hypothetical protein
MIRLLVLILIAANLFYFGWSQWVREEKPRLVTPAVAQATPRAAVAEDQKPCTTLGPERDETRALQIEQLLRDMQLAPSRRVVTTSAREGWWVYVVNPDVDSQARTLRAIQRAGIRDAFAMPEDPEFRVSVGLFMEESGAKIRAEAVRALQLDAKVSERTQQQTAIWFDLPGAARAAVDMSRLATGGIEVHGLRLEECPAGPDVSIDAIIPGGAAAVGPESAPRV